MISVCVILLVIGLFFNTVGVIGLLRFPDVYTRLHAETKTTTFGTIFISLSVAGGMLYRYFEMGVAGGLGFTVRIFIALFLLAFTNATGSHAIAQSAYARGQKPLGAVVDALSERPSEAAEDGK
jgi:multicomponent Na+:H+ antiporter subunit G